MTGPMPQQLDPRIQRNIQLMLANPKTAGDVSTYLREIEHVNPDEYIPKPGIGQQFMHGAGLIGRMALQGAGNLSSMPYGLAGAAYQGLTGNQPPGILQGNQGTAAADQLGLPQPQGAGERILSRAGENAVSMPLMGGGAGAAALGAVGGIAGQGAKEMGASPLGQAAAEGAVMMGVPVIGTMLAGATRAALAGSAARREAARQSLGLLQAGDATAPATLGQVTQGGAGGLLDAGLRKMPGANMAFSGALEQQAQGLSQRVQGVASGIGKVADPRTVGRTVQQGIENGFVPRFRATANKLFGQLDSYVPPDSPTLMSSTAKLFAEQNELSAAARPLSDQISSPFMRKWGEDLAATTEAHPQGVPFNVVKALRSRLGDMLSGAEMVTDVNLGDVKRLYGALSDDMGRTVQEVGGDQGMAAWNRASTYWKAGTERLQNILQPIMDKRTPDIAYTALMSGTKEAGTVLQTTMRSLGPEQRKLVSASVLGKLGMAEPGAQNVAGDVFSPDRFLTKWNTLSPIAKGALFDGISPTASKDLDALAKAMDLVKSANKRMPNPAGTASNVAFGTIMSGLGLAGAGVLQGNATMALAGAAPAAVAGAGTLLARRVFTNPQAIHWLVGTTKIPIAQLSRSLAVLAKDSQKWDPESQGLADEMIKTLGNVDWTQVSMAQAVADATARRQQP